MSNYRRVSLVSLTASYYAATSLDRLRRRTDFCQRKKGNVMWSTKQFGGLLVILLTAPVAGSADSTPAEALAELKRDLETISLDLTKSRQPRTTDVDQKAAVERYCLQAATLARRALALAEAHRDSPEAPEALAWILVGHLGDYTAKLDAECDSSYDLMAKAISTVTRSYPFARPPGSTPVALSTPSRSCEPPSSEAPTLECGRLPASA